MMFDAEFWVAAGFVIFIAVLWRLGAFSQIADSLDDRSARIRRELEEARRLREEAQRLLAEYEGKRRAAEQEAEAILAQARREAESMAHQAHTRMDEFVARRTRLAELKISQAEAQAAADVRSAAADAAIAAAERILSEKLKGRAGEALLDRSIQQVKTRLN